jgi:rsbT co-antagonist protein RsbR
MVERFRVAGIELEYDVEAGIHRWSGYPSLAMWLESSFAGLMSGVHRMVGTERFNVSLQGGGRDSTQGDWDFMMRHPTFEAGFAALADTAAAAGWGRWQLIELNREAKEARFRVLNSWESFYQRALGVDWGSAYVGGKFAGHCSRLFGTNCWAEQTKFIVRGDDFDEFFVKASSTTVEAELDNLLASDKGTRADLAAALERLRREMAEREGTERTLRDKLEFIERQEKAIQALSTPIIQVWDRVLALPIMGALDARRAADMMDRLLGEIVRTRSRFTILDLTGVDVVDTATADHLIKIVKAVELLGARSVITGIRPAVAQTMASLGMDLTQLTTLGNLQEGLKACMRWLAEADADQARGGE